jgi:hypothetical protein
MINYEQLATVLEKTADYLDAQEHEKTAAARDERHKVITAFAEKYAAATGEELSENVIKKLAASDVDLMGAFDKLASRVDGNTEPEDMGEPGDLPDAEPVYMTKKAEVEAKAQAAEDRFLSFIMSE